MRDFRQLTVWQRAHQLTLDLYCRTASFPRSEMFGLTGQIRRSAASVGANIAEGAGKYGHAELLRFLQIASGSASELENHILLARDLGFMTSDEYEVFHRQLQALRRMLTSFMEHLRNKRAAVPNG